MSDDNTPSAPVAPHGYGWRKLAFTLGVLGIAWVVFTQVAPSLTLDKGPHYSPASTDTVKALTARIETLENEIKSIKENGSGNDGAAMARLQKKIQLLQQHARRPDKRVDELQQQITSQQETIGKLENSLKNLQSETSTHVAGLTAFNQLREAVQRGEPFVYELKQLQSLTKDREDIQKPLGALADFAGRGVPTLERLVQTFERAVPQALTPGVKPDSLMGNLRSLVSIRKVGSPVGNDSPAIIARAETALKEDRVKSSLQLLKPLPQQSAAAFAEWKNDARIYVQSREALDALEVIFALKAEPEAAPPETTPPEAAPPPATDTPKPQA